MNKELDEINRKINTLLTDVAFSERRIKNIDGRLNSIESSLTAFKIESDPLPIKEDISIYQLIKDISIPVMVLGVTFISLVYLLS